MTPPNADAQYDADASAAVGYTYRQRSYTRRASTSTPRHPSTRCGVDAAAGSPDGSTVILSPGESFWMMVGVTLGLRLAGRRRP